MRKNYVKLTASLLTVALTIGCVSVTGSTTAGVTSYTSNIVTTSTMPTAGASSFLAEALTADVALETTMVAVNEAQVVKSEYADMAIAQVNDFVYVRSEADSESEYVGKLYNNNAATVLETKDGWYKIKSGDVTGYVSADYVVVGDEAVVEKASRRVALVTTQTLKVRKKASKKAGVITLVPEGDDLTVLDESKKGWVKVSTSEGKGYVSADYVSLSTEYTYAESKEAEKARLEKEEKERQEAAEAARRASESNSGSGNSGSGNGGSSSSDKKYKKPSGASGQAVANYACQFVGNPYVYGGTSLTNGADCSGFVMSVYKAFGVSLPHSSAALRSCGYGVSVKNMQPGDIVCYSGHVAIYIGNGAIVHASNRKSGIKISYNVNYRHVLAVRRIF